MQLVTLTTVNCTDVMCTLMTRLPAISVPCAILVDIQFTPLSMPWKHGGESESLTQQNVMCVHACVCVCVHVYKCV